MILYHGTDISSAKNIFEHKRIDVFAGKKNCDFGPGFYMSNSLPDAVKWAKRKAIFRHSEPAVVTLNFNFHDALEYIEFFSDDIRWARFIINNRNGLDYISSVSFQEHNLDRRYHITYGRIADKNVVDVSDELRESKKLLNDYTLLLKTDNPMQYVLHTVYATKFIEIKGYCKY